MVGVSPRLAKRCAAVLPRSLRRPSLMCGSSVLAAPIHTWMRPGSRSATAGAAPLYGTWFIFVPVSNCSIAAPRCCGLPLPEEPWFSSPGRDFAYETRSLTEDTGSDGCTTSRNWMRASWVMGARSVSGSNGGLPRCGFTANTLSGARSHVWPSGALLATMSEPMFWLPPGRFSTTTGCGHTPCRPAAIARAIVSGEPPGVSGTMILTGRSGKLWDSASVEKSATNPASSHLVITPPARDFAAHSLPTRECGIRWSFTGGAPAHVDPRGAGETFRRRDAVPLADPGAVRVERRVHALAAEREA